MSTLTLWTPGVLKPHGKLYSLNYHVGLVPHHKLTVLGKEPEPLSLPFVNAIRLNVLGNGHPPCLHDLAALGPNCKTSLLVLRAKPKTTPCRFSSGEDRADHPGCARCQRQPDMTVPERVDDTFPGFGWTYHGHRIRH